MTAALWLPRLLAIERCSGSRCEYLAWLVALPGGSVLTGAFGPSAREVSLWPSLSMALDAFGPDAVIDESPARHMTAAEAAFAVAVAERENPPHGPDGTEATAAAHDSTRRCPVRAGPGMAWARPVGSVPPETGMPGRHLAIGLVGHGQLAAWR